MVALPFAPKEQEQLDLNSAQDIANEYGIKYFNMNGGKSYIDYKTDMYDAGHLNSSGTRKATSVLGRWIADDFDLQNLKDSSIAQE